ncbi:hypothetical protein HMPREF1982_02191 [Clostridiales bacterium oral taxon 876 str. F0540]|nr:hypothetical protein HMPREF1982_02191 [Clostridiales bacterium oral taxon 876 str. F0540]
MKFNNYLNKLSYYFKDCYGFDRLSRDVVIVGAVLSLTRYTLGLSLVFVAYGIFRTCSKNKYKRYQELSRYENIISIIKKKFLGVNTSFDERKKYKIFKCPNCSQKLRVPRKKGKIVITCKKCGNEFKGRT